MAIQEPERWAATISTNAFLQSRLAALCHFVSMSQVAIRAELAPQDTLGTGLPATTSTSAEHQLLATILPLAQIRLARTIARLAPVGTKDQGAPIAPISMNAWFQATAPSPRFATTCSPATTALATREHLQSAFFLGPFLRAMPHAKTARSHPAWPTRPPLCATARRASLLITQMEFRTIAPCAILPFALQEANLMAVGMPPTEHARTFRVPRIQWVPM